MANDCTRCGGTGYVDSGHKAALIPGQEGVILKLDKPVPVQVPCPACNSPVDETGK